MPRSLQGTTTLRHLAVLLLCALLGVGQAGAGSMTLLGVGGPAAGGGGSFSITYESSANSLTHATTIDYGTLTYGAGCTRVVVGITAISSTDVSSISVNGVGGSVVSGSLASAGGPIISTIWMTSGPVSGSSGDVQVTFTQAIGDNSIVALYCLVTTTPTPTSGNNNSTNSAASINQTITVPSGGGAIAIGNVYIGGGASPAALSGITSDIIVNPAGHSVSLEGGHTVTSGVASVTAATVSGNSEIVLSLAAWGP